MNYTFLYRVFLKLHKHPTNVFYFYKYWKKNDYDLNALLRLHLIAFEELSLLSWIEFLKYLMGMHITFCEVYVVMDRIFIIIVATNVYFFGLLLEYWRENHDEPMTDTGLIEVAAETMERVSYYSSKYLNTKLIYLFFVLLFFFFFSCLLVHFCF
mgnify:CR=1 FL=1